MRLDKFLCECYLGTRSEVKKLIKQKLIFVNNQIITDDAFDVKETSDVVTYQNTPLKHQKYFYFALNKPTGYISAVKDQKHQTVIDLFSDLPLNLRKQLFPIGRLDIDTEGLIIITNDGNFAHEITSPKNHIQKTYYIEHDLILDDDATLKISNGLQTPFEKYQKATLKIISNHSCYLTITEGKYHQVKKMIHEVGGILTYLKRIKIGDYNLPNDLKLGDYIEISKEQIKKTY